jgi:hypothetical protein
VRLSIRYTTSPRHALTRQQQEFCPLIDAALVSAIYSDYAGTPNGLQQARVALDSIKQDAEVQQATDFDPSGSSGYASRSSPGKESDEAASNAGSCLSSSTVTDYTNISNELSALSLEGKSESDGSSDGGGYFRDTERFDTPTKELLLAETFPTLRLELITYTLKKCNNDFGKTTDELLNQVYFEDSRHSPTEEEVRTKGVDAFAEEFHVPQRGKKGRKKKQQGKTMSWENTPAVSDSEVPLTSPNRWQDGSKDVEFITARTNLSWKEIASLYHKNGASRAATIMALLDNDLKVHQKENEPETSIVRDAITLTDDFPSIDYEYAIALIRISAPSTANAHELAKALIVYPSTAKGRLEVIPRYASVNLSDPTSESSTRLPTLPPSATPHTTATLGAARAQAFEQAHAAHRAGKSKPNMRGVAAYYGQVGRDLTSHLHALSEADADTLVSRQSSPKHLDLHGVSVASAVRIAKDRTRVWWESLGEDRIVGGGRGQGMKEGYRIVTGLGRHSEGGRGKLGPAVVKALVGEGWKVEVGMGEVVVSGLARRK